MTTIESSIHYKVFDTGAFSEDSTFLVTDWLAHVPKEVIAKNFQASMADFDQLPGQELYIFPASSYIIDDRACNDADRT